jgi:hypothetical protein
VKNDPEGKFEMPPYTEKGCIAGSPNRLKMSAAVSYVDDEMFWRHFAFPTAWSQLPILAFSKKALLIFAKNWSFFFLDIRFYQR